VAVHATAVVASFSHFLVGDLVVICTYKFFLLRTTTTVVRFSSTKDFWVIDFGNTSWI
jgi:hypothetical protein